MKRLLAVAPVLLLAACASPQQWHVVGVYTDPDAPVPRNTGGASFTFTEDSFEGTTGCAKASGNFDDTVTLHNVQVGDPGDCSGWARHTHDQLAHLLTENTSFQVSHPADFEMILVADTGETIRLMR